MKVDSTKAQNMHPSGGFAKPLLADVLYQIILNNIKISKYDTKIN